MDSRRLPLTAVQPCRSQGAMIGEEVLHWPASSYWESAGQIGRITSVKLVEIGDW